MPTLGNALDFSKYEARNIRAHQLGSAPSSPVTGQLYYNTSDNTLYWFDGTAWQSAKGGIPAAHHATHEPGGNDAMAVDAATTTGSLRTIGTGGQQAMAGNRTLDNISPPLSTVNMNFQRLSNVLDPSASGDAATKNYVDGVAQGIVWKQPVKLVATTSIGGGSTPNGVQTVDGVATGANDRVLLTAQANPQFNGIWSTSTGSNWTRVLDANSSAELVNASVYVSEGTANADTAWVCTTNAPITVDTTPLTWIQFSGAAQIVSGAGLTKTGNTIDVGAGSGITVAADTVGITPGGVTDAMLATAKSGYYSTATHGAGTTFTITQAVHLLRASRGLIAQCQVEATGAVVLPDISIAANGDVTVTFGVSQTANTIRTTIVG